MMATEVAMQQPAIISYKAKPTQAKPKHSLFGTVLENVDKADLECIDPSLSSKIGVVTKTDRYPIPDDMQKHISARALLAKTQGDVNTQSQKLISAQKELRSKQLKALTFCPDPEDPKGKSANKTREGAWLSMQDLEHSSDINSVGLGKSGSYNRDRYSRKPPTHRYALIGDVLSKNNDFGQPQKYCPDETLAALNTSENNNREMIRLGFNPPVDPDVEAPLRRRDGIELPPNIRHRFGSKVCDELLQDPTTVRALLEKERRAQPLKRPKFEVDTKEYTAKAESGNYFEVGHVSRYNIFPGHSTLNPISEMKHTHSDVVYLRREPMIDEFRVIKDGYSVWAEQNLVREKLKKLWDAPKEGTSKM